jgi:hypothetical protein
VARFTRLLTRRAGPVGFAFTAWDIWRRIPPRHRKMLLKQARQHGPMIVKQARKHGPTIAKQLAERRKRR